MAWAAILIAAIAAVYAYSRIPKPQLAPPPSLDDLEAPTAEEGRSIPVLFGRRRIKSPNIVWYGDLNTTPVRQKVKGLLGSKYQNTGQYKVYLGMHMIIGVGPFDSIDKIEVGDKIAWEGFTTGGQIVINNNNLFGGDKKQGGVVGSVDIEMGLQDQLQNDYLLSVLGEDIPAYRGVVGVVLRHVYLGTTNYIKPWIFWGSRIHKRSDGTTQWYNEKAEVVTIPEQVFIDDLAFAATSASVGPYAGVTISSGFKSTDILIVSKPANLTYKAWSYWLSDGNPLAEGLPWTNAFWVTDDNNQTTLYWGGEVDETGRVTERYATADEADAAHAEDFVFLTGSTSYTFWIQDSPVNDNRGGLSLRVWKGGFADMNPAHIIREALTDRKFALRYSDSQITDASFMQSADTLHSEAMGMSLYWTGENSIEEFIGEVLRHIDGNCYVDKKTGQWVMPLVRDDYDVGELPVLNESNIVSVRNYKQPTIAELTNSVTVVYWDAITGEDASVTVRDPVLVDLQGGIVNETIQYPGFTNHNVASRAALRDLRARSAPMISCTITCDRSAADLNIGDPFLMVWPDLNINGLVMRVDSISLGDTEKAEIIIDCVQDVFSSPGASDSSPVAPPDPGLWVDPTSGDPQPAIPRLIMEAPYHFGVENFGQADVDASIAVDPGFGISLISAGRQGNELNADIFVDAGDGFEDLGDLDFAPWAEVEANSRDQSKLYIVGDTKDLSRLELPSLGNINDEIIMVDELSEDSGGEFFNVRRGVLDTIPDAHVEDSSGYPVLFLWGSYAESDELQRSASDSIDIKLLTKHGSSALPIEDAPSDAIYFNSRAVRPLPPANVRINGHYAPVASLDGDVELTFRERNRLAEINGLVHGWFEDVDVAGEVGQTYGYRIYDRDDLSLIGAATGLTGSPIYVSSSALGVRNRLEFFSERDGYESWTKPIIDFDYGFQITGIPPGGAVNESYSFSLGTDGAVDPVSWSIVSGALPTGWSIDSGTGEISGVASASGYSAFTVRAVDNDGTIAEKQYEIGIGEIVSLLHFNGANGSTTFTDETGKSWSRTGSAVISTAQSVFGGASLSLPATTDYLTAASHADFAYGTADFTVELWIRPTVLSGVKVFFDHRSSGAPSAARPTLYLGGSALRYYVNGADRISGGTLAINNWYHIALCKKAGETKLFLNGEQVGSTWTDSTSYTQGPLSLGINADNPGVPLAFQGFMDEVSVMAFAAKYSSGFTPPAIPSDYPVA